MKITTFNPLIISQDADSIISLFEELGFEKRHNKTGEDFSSNRMKDANGFHVDVTSAAVPQDMTTIRMNVDSFDEAYKLLTDRGFTIVQGGKVTDTGSSKSAMMVSPSGFSITVVEHIKERIMDQNTEKEELSLEDLDQVAVGVRPDLNSKIIVIKSPQRKEFQKIK